METLQNQTKSLKCCLRMLLLAWKMIVNSSIRKKVLKIKSLHVLLELLWNQMKILFRLFSNASMAVQLFSKKRESKVLLTCILLLLNNGVQAPMTGEKTVWTFVNQRITGLTTCQGLLKIMLIWKLLLKNSKEVYHSDWIYWKHLLMRKKHHFKNQQKQFIKHVK